MLNLLRAAAVPVAIVSLLALARSGCEECPWASGRGQSRGTPDSQKQAAGFKARSLTGKEIQFPDRYKDKLVLVDFWATWCPPCRVEIPHLREAHEKFGDKGLEVVGVSLDKSRGISAAQVRRFADQNGIKWELVYDGADRIARDYGVEFIPAPVLLDGASGAILAQGDELRGASLLKTLERHLRAGAP